MRHDEENLQMRCVAWFHARWPKMAALLHHSPNGGKRNLREAARFKRMGVRAGYPDLTLHVARGRWHGLFVEMKTDRGRLSPEQEEQRTALVAEGYRYEVARSEAGFLELMDEYLSLPPYGEEVGDD